MPVVGVLCFYLASRFSEARKDSRLSIRTPWTLNSDISWERTHLLAGRLFKVLGFVAFFSVMVVDYVVPVFVAPLVISIAGLIVYSYAVYHRIEHFTAMLTRVRKTKTV